MKQDQKLMKSLRIDADCILRGANTIKKSGSALTIEKKKDTEKRKKQGKTKHPLNVVVSSKLDFDYNRLDFFKNSETTKLIFTNSTSKNKIEKAKRYAQVIRVKSKNAKVDVKEVIKILKTKFKCGNILLEGGGELNFSMLKNNLIDEIYMTICPYIFGGETGISSFGGEGFKKEDIKSLKLLSIKKNNFEELFLHYKVLKNKGVSFDENK